MKKALSRAAAFMLLGSLLASCSGAGSPGGGTAAGDPARNRTEALQPAGGNPGADPSPAREPAAGAVSKDAAVQSPAAAPPTPPAAAQERPAAGQERAGDSDANRLPQAKPSEGAPASPGRTAAAGQPEPELTPAQRLAATVSQNTYGDFFSKLSADRTPLSWYYMKKPKGQVPGFPADIKKYKPTDKAVWVGTGKKVYLTLDNGGPMGDTDKLLKALRDNDVKANFFIAGYNMKAHPDYVKTLVDEGHLVANHTMSHKDFNELSDAEIVKEIADYEKLYKEITGKEIEKFFRFPYGHYNLHILDLVSQLGYTSVFWSTAMRDWEPRPNGAEDPYNDIMNNLHDGNIILMHQGSPENIEALDRIIKAIKEAGYEFALLNDIEPPPR